MLKITQIPNLFSSSHKLTTHVLPTVILHPQIKTDIINIFHDSIEEGWLIGVFSIELNVYVPYVCITSPRGNMYRIEYINISIPSDIILPSEEHAYRNGYKIGINRGLITLNPFSLDTAPKHWKYWIDGYHNGYKNSETPY